MTDFTALTETARQQGALVAQGQACIGSALRLSEMTAKERWDVDLSVPRFEWKEGEALLFAGRCQLLGTFVEGDGFCWGHQNPSVPQSAWNELLPVLQGMPEVAPLLETRAFRAPREELSIVMQWLAVRAGFTGCFEGQVGAATSFLAVRLDEGQGAGGWCAWCGSTRHQVRSLIAGPRGVMICNTCGELVGDMVAAEEPREGPAPEAMGPSAPPALRVCVFCEQPKGGLLMGPHAGLCRDCASLVGEVLESQRASP
jgi:hypothetical protein